MIRADRHSKHMSMHRECVLAHARSLMLHQHPLPSLTAQVAVLGAGGGIGQPLSLLLKLNSQVSQLALYDIAGTPGV